MLPSPALPEGALLMFEQMTADADERADDPRFYVRDDGGFFHVRGWDEGFPQRPVRRLDAAGVDELRGAVAVLGTLDAEHRRPPSAPEPSTPVVERWTGPVDGRPVTVVADEDAIPPELARLRDLVDRLVAASARC